MTWLWEEHTAISAGEETAVLPTPDPEQWVLSSGWMYSSGEASFGASFYSEDVPEDQFAGHASVHYQTLGANRALLTDAYTGLLSLVGWRRVIA